MATRSFIHVQRTDGKWARIYCHSDGYWSHNGRLLQQYYASQERAEALVALGDISSLAETIGVKHDFDYRFKFYDKYGSNRQAMYEDPEYLRLARMCMAYGRDRGEKNVDAAVGDTLEEVFEDEEYVYVWRDGEWLGMSYTDDLTNLRPLKDILYENNIVIEADDVFEDESYGTSGSGLAEATGAEQDVATSEDDGNKPFWAA
jgi:hypothetical protein